MARHRIESEAGLKQTIDVIRLMYEALADLHQRVAPVNFKNYLIMAEGPLEEIRRARRDIEEYLGITDFVPKFEQEMRALEAEEDAPANSETPLAAKSA
jgi:hypothetical protein